MAPRARSIARGYVKVSEIHHRDAGPEDGFPDKTSDDRIKETSSSFGSITRLLLTKTSGTIAAIATLTFAACSSQPNLTPAQKGGRRIRRDEFRSRRQVLAHRAHLYRCPAIDKPLCSVEYSLPDIQCVRIGPKGHVFVAEAEWEPLRLSCRDRTRDYVRLAEDFSMLARH